MTPGPRITPPSRQGKKQVIAFLRPNQAQAAYDKAARDDKTNQEIIGEALNAVFAFYGMPPPVELGHRRIVRRGHAKAGLRDDTRGPNCRAGRVSFGGWFDESVKARLQKLASEFQISEQSIIEHGLQLVTGVAPSEVEEWAVVEAPAEPVREEAA